MPKAGSSFAFGSIEIGSGYAGSPLSQLKAGVTPEFAEAKLYLPMNPR